MTRRGERFDAMGYRPRPRSRALVGNALYHTVGDRLEAVKQLGRDWNRIVTDIENAIGVVHTSASDGAPMNFIGEEGAKAHPTWFVWYQSAVVPWNRDFWKFHAEMVSGDTTGPLPGYVAYGNRFETDWPVFEEWRRRLAAILEGAQKLGMVKDAAPPKKLPTTSVEDAGSWMQRQGHDAKEKAGEAWTLAKVAVYGGLGLVGVIAIGSLVSNMKSGKDPAANYLRLAGRR